MSFNYRETEANKESGTKIGVKYSLDKNESQIYNNKKEPNIFSQAVRKYHDTKKTEFYVNVYDNYYQVKINEDYTYEILNAVKIEGNEDYIKEIEREATDNVDRNGTSDNSNTESIKGNKRDDNRDNVDAQRLQSWTEFVDEVLEGIRSGRFEGRDDIAQSERNSTGKELVDSSFFDGDNNSQLSLSNQNTTPLNGTNGRDLILNKAPLPDDLPIRQDIAPKNVQQNIGTEKVDISKYLKPYSEHQKKNWKNSKRIVVYENNAQLQMFLTDAKAHKIQGQKMYFGRVSDIIAQRVMSELEYDIENYNCTIKADEVEKIFKSHGDETKEAARGQRAVTDDDFKKIPEVLGTPDGIEFAGAYKGKPAIKFQKDGHTIIAVMSDKHLDLYVQTMYVGKKNRSLATPIDENPLSHTPEARSGTASNFNIPHFSENATQFSVTHTALNDAPFLVCHSTMVPC